MGVGEDVFGGVFTAIVRDEFTDVIDAAGARDTCDDNDEADEERALLFDDAKYRPP
jgi:hypothetical protein